MSCPDVGLHAHPTVPVVDPTARPVRDGRRKIGLGAAVAWSFSFAGHAGVIAWLMFADPPPAFEDSHGAVMVELIAADADVAAASNASNNASAPASAPPTPPQEIATPALPKEIAALDAPTEASAQAAVADTSVTETVVPISELALVEPPRRPQVPEALRAPATAEAPAASAHASQSAPGAARDMSALPSNGAGETAAAPRGDNRKPTYPAYARRRGLEGRVILQVDVTPEGTAGDVAVSESSQHDFFDDAALDAVRTWRFQPARRDGVPISSRLRVPITFRLTDL